MRELLAVLVIGLLLPAPGGALAVERAYGAAAGIAAPLGPADDIGACIGLSALAIGSAERASAILRARGELFGFITGEAKAVLPTITGDAGFSLGRVDFFLSSGVQIFGFAWRSAALEPAAPVPVERGTYTVFASFGLVGGGGLGVKLTDHLRASARGLVIWLPSMTTATIAEPPAGSRPTFAFVAALLSFEYVFERLPGDRDFELF